MTDQTVTIPLRRRPEARPAEILSAALELFTEKGFSATRLDDVASRAGLSKAAIYLYFKDKVSILKALVEQAVSPSITLAQTMATAHQGPVTPLLSQVLALLAGRLSESRLPHLIKLVISESRAHPEIGRYYLENVIARALPLFESLIARGIASGEFRRVDPGLAVKCMIGPMLLSAVWTSVFVPLGAEPIDIRKLAALHADLIARGLKP